jgi:hypothetical protein
MYGQTTVDAQYRGAGTDHVLHPAQVMLPLGGARGIPCNLPGKQSHIHLQIL